MAIAMPLCNHHLSRDTCGVLHGLAAAVLPSSLVVSVVILGLAVLQWAVG
jgi:hypothetical protein